MQPAAQSTSDRRERRKREVRDRILHAAFELIEERGSRGVTVVEICARADVAKASFFNHFAGKTDLLRGLAAAFFDRILADVHAACRREPTLAGRLRLVFAGIATHMEGARPSGRETTVDMIRAVQDGGVELEESCRLRAAFARLAEEGLARGEVDAAFRSETYAEMIGAIYFGLITSWIQDESYPVVTGAAEAARFLAHALRPTNAQENPDGTP